MAEPLSRDRIGQIAVQFLILKMAKEREFPSEEQLKRGLPDIAKELNISPEDLWAFVGEIMPKVVEKRLGCSGVTMQWPART